MVVSYLDDVNFSDDKPVVSTLIKTDIINEMRIAFKKGQVMKEHKAPFPILVNVVSGAIGFDAEGEVYLMKTGDTIMIHANLPHELSAIEESVVRVTLVKTA